MVVRGTLLHEWRRHDQTGNLVELHLLVLAHFRLYVIKANEPFPRRLAFGRSLTAIGALVVPHPSHLSIHEVDAAVITGA